MGEKADFSGLSPAQKVGQLFFIGIGSPELDDVTKRLLDEVSPGGVCLFARNIREALQTRELLDGLREYFSVTPFLSIDQEGGLVDRLRRIMTPMPAPNKLRTTADAAELGSIIGATLRILGFNMDFAPVVDVIDDVRSHYQNGLFSRTFGKSKEDVTIFARQFLQGLRSHGITGCLKHFPGLGASRVDSHEELPVVDLSEQDLNYIDLFPYWQLLNNADVHALMVAHAAYPRLPLQETGQNGKLLPSSLSYNFVTKLLRGELGFDGLVITDDLEMGAIVKNYGVGEACKMAINAGVDMLAICADPNAIREGYRAVLSAVKNGMIAEGRLDTSLERISDLKRLVSEPPAFDESCLNTFRDRIASLSERLS
jgi:beta-N-acetylhexosaminidase